METVSANPVIQERYERMRAEGVSHTLAEMFALQHPPMSNTDREFLEGHANGNQFEKTPWIGDLYRQRATEDGVDTAGKVYMGSLAEYPGDPRAWVGGRGDVQQVCEERGYGCQGAVTVQAPQRAQLPEIGVADDLVEEATSERIERQPELGLRDREEVKAETREQIKPPWAK